MPLEIDRIKGLCFDVDGTLSDTDDRWAQKLGHILRPFHRPLQGLDTQTMARFCIMAAETPGNLLYTLMDRLGFDDEIGYLFSRLNRRDHHPDRFWIIPGARECLAELSKRYSMAIVSARGADDTQAFLRQFELQTYFQAVASAQTCKFTKPYPDPVIWAAKQLQLLPEQCLMIGDTSVDVKAGRRAGAQTVGVLCGFGTESELRKTGADLILPSTAMLAEFLR